jgi:hypothetical protein
MIYLLQIASLAITKPAGPCYECHQLDFYQHDQLLTTCRQRSVGRSTLGSRRQAQ